MSLLITYIIFALTTAVTSVLELLHPVISRREADTNKRIPRKLILYSTFFVFGVVLAPIIFFSCVVPSMSARFRSSLYDGLFSKD